MNTLLKTSFSALAMAVALGAAMYVQAAEVQVDLSSREAYVGMPIFLDVHIANATDFDPPTVPEVPGLRIEPAGVPSQSTQTTIINGSVTMRKSMTYSFSLTPTQPGTFRIPEIEVRADGQTLSTRPFEFVAAKSETGDLLFVEIEGKEKQIYVGQALDLMLKIWVRPYRDQEHNITLSEGDMWQLLSERTDWGPFAERVQQLADSNQRPVGIEVLRKDREGANHSYYLYEIDATIYPKKPGRIDANDVQVRVMYPTAIGEAEDMFGGFFGGRFESPFAPRLTIESVRPVVAEAKVEPIEVMEIPVANRPADYRGAVGKYLIRSDATPKQVKAGDPIQLVLSISGTGPLDLVQAPPLADLPELARDFKVPNEPLAGYVDGGRKLFATTIRPRKEGIAEIPSIPFTYFDPEVGKFVTAKSDQIKIKVAPADVLALADVVGRNKADNHSSGSQALESAAAGPVLDNFTGTDLLQSTSSPVAIGRVALFVLALPPVVVLGLLLARAKGGAALVGGRFRSTNRRFQSDVAAASNPTDVATTLRRLLAKRFGLPASAGEADVVGSLRSAGYRNLAVRCERLFDQCNSHGNAGLGAAPELADLQQNALDIVAELQTQKRPAASSVTRPTKRLKTTAAAMLIAAALLSFAGNANAAPTAAASLTPTQQETILTEANDRYSAGRQAAANDSAESKEAFAEAAHKYQLLVDAGIQNPRLYFNLGNAYLESGASGRAIANYRRALALDSTNRAAQKNLAFAEAALAANTKDANSPERTAAAWMVVANDWLNRFVSPRTVFVVATSAWFAFWIALGLRLVELQFSWKTAAVATLAIAVLAATSFTLSHRSLEHASAVVVATDAELRVGDGASFPAAGGAKLAEGESVDFLRQRGEWVQIRTPGGTSGWLPETAVEVL